MSFTARYHAVSLHVKSVLRNTKLYVSVPCIFLLTPPYLHASAQITYQEKSMLIVMLKITYSKQVICTCVYKFADMNIHNYM